MFNYKRINLFVFSFVVLMCWNGEAQVTSFEFSYDEQDHQLKCIHKTEAGSEFSESQVEKDQCLHDPSSLITPITYILGDNDKCYAFLTEAPFYFAGEVGDKSRCANSTANSAKFNQLPNELKFSQDQVSSVCSELGNCLYLLKDRSQDLVDDIVAILDEIDINSKLDRLSRSVEQDQFNFILPEFLNNLEQLKDQNERCHNSFDYGAGDRLAASDSLAKDLEKIANTLDEDLYVFHWYEGIASSFSTSTEGDSNAIARAHARMLQNNYFSWDFNRGTGMQGRGLYASGSPRATEDYGNILLKIRIPAGSRYLNMQERGRFRLSRQTVELLSQAGCNIGSDEGWHVRDRGEDGIDVNKISFSSERACRRIFNSVIQSNDYKFHSYGYQSRDNSICDSFSPSAFVLIQNEMSSENVTAFRKPFQSRQSMSEEARELYDLSRQRRLLTTERQEELANKYSDHLWRCQSHDQH